ncbi:MAG: caspase family protein, partial [Desulfobacterales bacterium]
MILRKFTVLTSSLLFLFLAANLSGENRGIKLHVERLALVIGNSAYQTAPLKNPLNDAEDMTATLKKMGFKVILKKNADQRTMEDTIRYFGRQLRNGGIGLFYFAG